MRYIPERLVEARKLMGLTQKQLAERIGAIQPMIYKWESGSREPNGESVKSLAEALGKPIDFFFETTPEAPSQILARTAPMAPSKAKHIRQAKARLLAVRDRLVQALEGQIEVEKLVRPTLKDVLAAVDEIDKLLEG